MTKFQERLKQLMEGDYDSGLRLAEEIGKMLWRELIDLEVSIKNNRR